MTCKPPKFDIPVMVSERELQAMIQIYALRLSHFQSDNSYIRWNVDRMHALTLLLPKPTKPEKSR